MRTSIEAIRIPIFSWVGLMLAAPLAFAQSPNPFFRIDNAEAIRYLARSELFVDLPSSTFTIRLPTDELLVFESVDVSINAGIRIGHAKTRGWGAPTREAVTSVSGTFTAAAAVTITGTAVRRG